MTSPPSAGPEPASVHPATRKTTWAWLIATFFGAGYGKPGPGTWGSVAAVLLWYAAANLTRATPAQLAVGTLIFTLIATAIGIPAATIVARESACKDPQIVVIDEVAGQWLTLLFLPGQLQYALLGLICFRVFDITKPPPIRQLEKLPTGIGIVVDDLGAGIYGLLAAQLAYHFLH